MCPATASQVGGQSIDFVRAPVAGVGLAVEQGAAPDLAEVGLFGAVEVEARSDGIAEPTQKLLGTWLHQDSASLFDLNRLVSYTAAAHGLPFRIGPCR